MFTDSYHPAMDGVVRNIDVYAKELRRLGHEVTVFAPSTGRKNHKEEDAYYFSAFKLRRYPSYRLAAYPSNFDNVMRGIELDVVHSHGFAAMGLRGKVISRKRGIPYLFTFHTMVPQVFKHQFVEGFEPRYFERLFWRYMRMFLKHNDVTIYPSEWTRETVVKAVGREFGTSVILPTGVETDSYRPDDSLPKDSPPNILHVGRVSREKEIETAIEVFARVKEEMEVTLTVVGDGPALAYYKEYAKRKGIDVRFAGFVPEEQLVRWYRRSAMLILPSRFETQGIVPLEAMACGLPVLASRHPAFLECWNDGDAGHFFDGTDDAAKKAISILQDPGRYALGARARAEGFSIRRLTSKLLEVYQRAIDERR
jgi:glycosyltransferase involved in cell wall biosynthesis